MEIGIIGLGFGGHPFGKDDAIAKERKTGKVGLSDKQKR